MVIDYTSLQILNIWLQSYVAFCARRMDTYDTRNYLEVEQIRTQKFDTYRLHVYTDLTKDFGTTSKLLILLFSVSTIKLFVCIALLFF